MNIQRRRFLGSSLGPGICERFSSRGDAFGDYDNDGDIDALLLNMKDPPSLLRNDGGNQQNWIKIKLFGTSEKPAVSSIPSNPNKNSMSRYSAGRGSCSLFF